VPVAITEHKNINENLGTYRIVIENRSLRSSFYSLQNIQKQNYVRNGRCSSKSEEKLL
jgi:hypothetical protein